MILLLVCLGGRRENARWLGVENDRGGRVQCWGPAIQSWLFSGHASFC